MIVSNLKPKTVRKTSLWFGQFRYCLSVFLTESHTLRYRSHLWIDQILERRREWGRRIVRSSQPGSWRWEPLVISDDDRANLHAMLDFLATTTRELKTGHCGNWIHIYTADLDLVEEVINLDFLNVDLMSLRQIELKGQPNSVCLKTVNHRFRSYFRNLKLSPQNSLALTQIIKNQSEIRLSPSLKNSIEKDRLSFTRDHYFIDHDDPRIMTLFSLVVPNLIRQTVPIVADK